MEQFTVQLNNATCTVCIGAGVLGRAGTLLRQHVPQVRRWALAADENASALYGEWVQGSLRAAGLQVRLFPLPQGESAKTPEAWLSLCRRILDSGFDRSCGVVTRGGGAGGDAAGFAAASLLRGVPLAHIPTTLLAQVDSALGGKTALDLPEGKNLLGAFHQPSLVLSDPACLATLPQRQFASGMAEVIKTGLVADETLLAAAEQGLRDILVLWDCTQAEAAKRLGMAQPTLANKLRLLQLTGDQRQFVLDNNLTERHARAVLRLPENRRSEALINIAKRRLNARQTDLYIEQLLNSTAKGRHRISMVRDVRIFVNTIDHAIRLMTDNGVPATAHREERDGYIEYTVRIPTAAAQR